MTSAASAPSSDLVKAITSATVYDLGQPTHALMPQLPGAPRYTLTLLRRHGDLNRDGGFSSANELLVSICHAGTHIDAIGHVSVNGKLHGGIEASEVQVGTRGLQQLGIEQALPMVRRGVLLDIAGMLGVEALDPATPITGELLERCAGETGVSVGDGDTVLVRTGWGRFWDDPVRYVSETDGLPGVNIDGAVWLSDRGVTITGADCLMYEYFHPSANELPVHSHLIQGHGVHLIENMLLEPLADAGVHEFAFIVSPLKLVGATGSPVRPIAIA